MDILTQQFLAPFEDESENQQRQAVNAVPFPAFWLDPSQRNIEGLRVLAAHLDTQMTTIRNFPSGVIGNAKEVEKQIINHQSNNAHAISVLAEVVQSSLLMIANTEERRFSQRTKRAVLLAWTRAKSVANRVWENSVFKVFGALSTIAFVYTVLSRLLGK